MNKKSISPVVATALLIVVSVVAVIGFQTWFQTYSSDLFVKTEKDSSSTSNTNIETLVGDQLYFKNNLDNLTIKQIKIGNKECNLSINLTKGVHNISLGDCINNLTTQVNDITVITDEKVYTKKHLFKDVKEVTTTLTPPAPLTNYFGDGSDGDIKVNSSGVYQDLGSGYQLHPNTTGTEWNSTEDGDMIVINAQDFLVESGVTFSTTKRCRGLMIYAQGNVTVDGTISMTARGAYANPANNTHIDTPVPPSDGNIVPSEGIVLRFLKNESSDIHNSSDIGDGLGISGKLAFSQMPNISGNGIVFKIPREGGIGGYDGNVVLKTTNGTGGGGGNNGGSYGGNGTCFSGGAGAGQKTNGGAYGGAGGFGNSASGVILAAGGGAGNNGGGFTGNGGPGEDGTGGLLIVVSKKIINITSTGILSSQGSKGGKSGGPGYYNGNGMPGSGSGGGIIGIFYGSNLSNLGEINVSGGLGGLRESWYEGPLGGVGTIIGPIKIDS